MHELVRLVPGSAILARGKQSVDEVAESARAAGYQIVALVTELHGNPNEIRVMEVDEAGWRWLPESFIVRSLRLSREFGTRVHPPDALQVDGRSLFAKSLGIEPEESDTAIREVGGTLTFLQDGKEVGPRMSIKAVRHEAGD